MVINDSEDLEPRGPSPLTAAFLLSLGGLLEGSGIVHLRTTVNLLNIMIFDKLVINMSNTRVMNTIFKIVNFMVKIFRA